MPMLCPALFESDGVPPPARRQGDHPGKTFRAKGLAVGLALFSLFALACSDKRDLTEFKATSRVSLGFYAGDDPIVYNSVTTYVHYLNAVSVARYSVDTTGAITGSLPNTSLLPFDRGHGIHTYACIVNGGFDPDLGHSALVTNKAAVLTNLMALTTTGGYEGVNLDFEGLYPSDRAAYTQFVAELAAKLHAGGYKLILSIPSVTVDNPADSWAGAFDYPAIGQNADLLQLMTYDENGPGWSDPGPVAGADWVEQCVAYAATVVSPSKLLIGLGAYGYDWDLTAYATTGAYPDSYIPWTSFSTWLAVPGAVQHWDTATLSPYVTYTLDGHDHVGWYENAASIQAKTALVKKYNLGGLSVWALGQDDLVFWKAAMAGLQ